MSRQFSSKLSTDQLIQLAKQVLNSRDYSHVEWLMRAHTLGSTPNWNRQELIAFLAARNGGTEPDKIVENMQQAALRKQQAQQKQIQQTEGVVLRRIDLSQQGQPAPANPRAAVYVECKNCGVESVVKQEVYDAAVKAGQTFYCGKCSALTASKNTSAEQSFQEFVRQVPQYYPDPQGHNAAIFAAEIDRRKLTNVSVADLVEIFVENRSRMLGRLTESEVMAMDSSTYNQRLKIDPGMGGCDLTKAKEGQKHGDGTEIYSTNKSRLMPFAPAWNQGEGR